MTNTLFSNRDLKILIFPLVIEQILSMLVGMVDTVMVSYAGEAAISGVALVDMINYLFITIFAAIATGGAVIVSQYLGDRQEKQANLAAGQLYTISAVVSTVIALVCFVFHKGILQLLYGSVEADVILPKSRPKEGNIKTLFLLHGMTDELYDLYRGYLDGGLTPKEILIGSAKYVLDEDNGKLTPAIPNQKPFTLTNGMMVKYSGVINDAGVDKDFEVTSKLNFKKKK